MYPYSPRDNLLDESAALTLENHLRVEPHDKIEVSSQAHRAWVAVALREII